MTTTDVMKYLKPGAIVPVDVQTTALLVNALREALASQGEALASEAIEQPAQQEPVAWRWRMSDVHPDIWNHSRDAHPGALRKEPLYTSPPIEATPLAQRQARSADTWVNATTWRGLTDAEVMQTMSGDWTSQFYFARAIEAKLKEKNCG